jgi:hypothetical protein
MYLRQLNQTSGIVTKIRFYTEVTKKGVTNSLQKAIPKSFRKKSVPFYKRYIRLTFVTAEYVSWEI